MRHELSVYDGMIMRGNRIVIPKSLQKRVLNWHMQLTWVL